MRIVVLLILIITGCASEDPRPKDKEEWLAYGINQIKGEHYLDGMANIKSWQQDFPVDDRNRDAYLSLIFANFETENYDVVMSYATRFKELYPGDSQMDYVMYMEAMAHYERSRPMYEDYVWTDIAQRDPGEMLKSFAIFKDIVVKYPDSIWAYDSYHRIIYINERLAEREIKAIRFFYKKGYYVSVMGRANYIIENFSNTKYFEYALAVMVDCAKLLNDEALATKYSEALAMYDPNFKLPLEFYLDE